MTDDLRRLYEQAGKLKYYFDKKVPRDLFRGQSRKEERAGTPVLYPNPGFTKPTGAVRLPDVEIVERDGKKWVKGCRCLHGDYRGVSTFDRINPSLKGFSWHKLPQGTDIPEALAITQDSDFKDRANHFTVAPKDDMPLELFQVWLNTLAEAMKKVDA